MFLQYIMLFAGKNLKFAFYFNIILCRKSSNLMWIYSAASGVQRGSSHCWISCKTLLQTQLLKPGGYTKLEWYQPKPAKPNFRLELLSNFFFNKLPVGCGFDCRGRASTCWMFQTQILLRWIYAARTCQASGAAQTK